MHTSKLTLNNLIVLLSGSLILGIIFNYFFNNNTIGVSYFISVVLFYVYFIITCRPIINWKNWFANFLFVPILLLSLTFAIFNNPILSRINFLLIPILLITQLSVFTNSSYREWFYVAFFLDVINKIFLTLWNVFAPFRTFYNIIFEKLHIKNFGNNLKRVGKVVFITLPVFIIVFLLLLSADKIFSNYYKDIQNWFENFKLENIADNIFGILITMLLIAGFLFTLYKYYNVEKKENIDTSRINWDSLIFNILLFGLNIVYVLFVIIQFVYLFGGEENIIKQGMSYSEYAVSGFWELMAISIINILVILLGSVTTNKITKKAKSVFNIMSVFLVINSLIILYSSHTRLALYENTYGFTYDRIFSHTIVFLLAVLIIMSLIKVWNRKFIYMKGFLISCLVVYVALNFICVDSLIAKENIKRYLLHGKLDVHYLTVLSTDANDVLFNFFQNEKILSFGDARKLFKKLNDDYNKYEKINNKWFEYNRSIYRTKNLNK